MAPSKHSPSSLLPAARAYRYTGFASKLRFLQPNPRKARISAGSWVVQMHAPMWTYNVSSRSRKSTGCFLPARLSSIPRSRGCTCLHRVTVGASGSGRLCTGTGSSCSLSISLNSSSSVSRAETAGLSGDFSRYASGSWGMGASFTMVASHLLSSAEALPPDSLAYAPLVSPASSRWAYSSSMVP